MPALWHEQQQQQLLHTAVEAAPATVTWLLLWPHLPCLTSLFLLPLLTSLSCLLTFLSLSLVSFSLFLAKLCFCCLSHICFDLQTSIPPLATLHPFVERCVARNSLLLAFPLCVKSPNRPLPSFPAPSRFSFLLHKSLFGFGLCSALSSRNFNCFRLFLLPFFFFLLNIFTLFVMFFFTICAAIKMAKKLSKNC